MDASPDPEQRLKAIWDRPPGVIGWLSSVNSTQVGQRYIATAFFFLLVGGVLALLMRIQLVVPNNPMMGFQRYNELFTMHGTTMLFLFAVPMIEGLGTWAVPLMVGARDMAFPRLNAFGYWCFTLGGVLLYSSFLFGSVPDGGWFAYPPLTSLQYSPGMALDFWLLAVTFVEISGVVFAIETITTVFRLRAPGVALNRIPLFVWNILVVAFMMLFAFPAVITASLMLELERAFGLPFFEASRGGDPLLWQHLFWIFGHPEVYIIFLPAAGIISEVVPAFSRRPIVGYHLVVLAAIATGFISFGLWVHHMFTTGLPQVSLSLFSAASMLVAIPSGIQVFAWLGTLWTGRPRFRPPLLFAAGFIVLFVAGGVTGVMVGLLPLDYQLHDSYFVVAHFHYVLIGGAVFPIFAGLHYWAPKMTGRMLSDRLGAWTFGVMFVGFNLAFFPLHNAGLRGMPRRIYTYEADLGWHMPNLLATLGAFMFGAGILLFVLNFIRSLRAGAPAGANPWEAPSIEWSIPSPVPSYNFRSIPQIDTRDPLWGEPADAERWAAGRSWLATASGDNRETMGTSPFDATPEQVVRVATSSLAPLLTAASIASLLVLFLFEQYQWTPLPALALAACILAWLWPHAESGEAERRADGLPVGLQDGRSTVFWGAALFSVASGTILLYLVSSFLYLGSNGGAWPPALPAPPLAAPIAALVLLAAGAVLTGTAGRRFREGRSGLWWLLLAGLAVAIVIPIVVVHARDYVLHGVTAQGSGYGASFYTILAFVGLHAAIALVAVLLLTVRAATGRFAPQRPIMLVAARLLTWYAAGAAAVAFAVLHLAPRLW